MDKLIIDNFLGKFVSIVYYDHQDMGLKSFKGVLSQVTPNSAFFEGDYNKLVIEIEDIKKIKQSVGRANGERNIF